MSSISLVVPCFNESERFNVPYWTEISEIKGIHLVFIDDGSKDRTRSLLTEFASAHSSEVLHHDVNLGKAEAVRTGIQHVLASGSGSIVGFLDADGAVPEDEVRRCIEVAKGLLDTHQFDAVWASRVALAGRNIVRSDFRHYVGRIIATLVSRGIEGFPYDSQCGFKLFDASDELSAVLHQPFSTKWFVDVEIMLRWQSASNVPLRIYEEPLHAWSDQPGGNLSAKNVLSVVKEVLAIRSMSRQLREGRNRL